MKKILESELMSIAHSILKLKGREDIEKMYLEAQKLYEKISILRYYEKNNLLNSEEISIEKLVTSVTFNNTLENVDNEDFENINNSCLIFRGWLLPLLYLSILYPVFALPCCYIASGYKTTRLVTL